MAVARPFEVMKHRTDKGEWFPILVYAETGLPVRLPLRYSFVMRFKGGSQTLKRRLKNIALLYEWFARNSNFVTQNFEDILCDAEFVDLEDIKQAMVYADSLGEPTILPIGHTVASIPIKRPHDHNLRMQDWREFLEWALEPRNWQTGPNAQRATIHQRISRDAIRREFELFFEAASRSVPKNKRRAGFSDTELEVLEILLVPDRNGEWTEAPTQSGRRRRIFADNTRFRNYLIYCLLLEVGLRRGEVLKLKIDDLPQRRTRSATGSHFENNRDRQLRWTNDGRITVRRREDDPEDPRGVEPRVKREDRLCYTPDYLLEDIWRYIESPPPLGRKGFRNGYVFLTHEGAPMSVSAIDDVSRAIQKYSSRLFDQMHPDLNHTLGGFSWHRLRHTAAKDILQKYKESGDDNWRTHFKEHFGWASMDSAEPYIDELLRAAGTNILRAHDEMREDDDKAYARYLALEGEGDV